MPWLHRTNSRPSPHQGNPYVHHTGLAGIVWLRNERRPIVSTVMLGRSGELAAIEQLIASAVLGQGQVLVVRGEPGIGKTTLLQTAQGTTADVRVLSISGVQSESDVPNAGLLSLLRPVLFLLPRLTTVGAATLRQALGLEDDAPPSQFGVAGATLELLAAASAEQPTIITIDDAQWIDAQSMFCLMFALRRLHGDSIGALLTFLAGHAVPAALHDLPHLELTGLGLEDTNALVQSYGHTTPPVVAELHNYTGGNPLALHEISRTLTARQRAGLRPVGTTDDVLSDVRRRFDRTLASLDVDSRLALKIAALDSTGDPEVLRSALSHVNCPAGSLDSDRLSQFLLRTPESVAFRHPLIRAAAQGERTQRRTAHLALAHGLALHGPRYLRAWHLSEASPEKDAAIALALCEAATEASQQGDLPASARLYELAARHSPEGVRAAEWLHLAGACATVSGDPRGPSLLEAARAGSTDTEVHGQVDVLLARHATWNGDQEGIDRVAGRSDAVPPAAAAQIHAMAATSAFTHMRRDAFITNARLSFELSRDLPGEQRIHPDLALAYCRAAVDEDLPEVRPPTSIFLSRPDPDLGCPLALTLIVHGLSDEAAQVIEVSLALARHRRSIPAIAWLRATQACLSPLRGDLQAGRAAAVEAIELGETIGGTLVQAAAHVWGAMSAQLIGDEDQCLAHLDAAQAMASERRPALTEMIAVLVRARLNRAGGYTELAIRQYQSLSDELQRRGLYGTALLPALPELIDILARTGHLTEARTLLPRLRAEGGRFSFPQQRAALEHCEAVTVEADRLDSAFGRALEARDASPNPLARSHTLLAWGERLRRARRPRDARAPLLEALDGFEQMGSAPWARAARRELSASGGSMPPPRGSRETLTPQEQEVARFAASGASTNEIAAALFVSPKTVEAHLTRVYRKLNVRGRAGLTERLSQ